MLSIIRAATSEIAALYAGFQTEVPGLGLFRGLLQKVNTVLFNNWVRQDLVRDRVNIFSRLLRPHALSQFNIKELALPDIGDELITEGLEGGLESLPLRIEDSRFQRNVYSRLHEATIIPAASPSHALHARQYFPAVVIHSGGLAGKRGGNDGSKRRGLKPGDLRGSNAVMIPCSSLGTVDSRPPLDHVEV